MNDAAARETMIDTQVRPNDVVDRRIHAALMNVPREPFLPRTAVALAYAEMEHETSPGRSIWRARDFGKLLEECQFKEADEVLVIGSGAGYSEAVISHLVDVVVGLESDADLAVSASDRLSELNIDNADVIKADLEAGLPDQAPFDVIFVNGALETDPPKSWFYQLKEGGRLAVVVREGKASHARIYVRSGDVFAYTRVFDAAPPVLPGFEPKKVFSF